MGERESGVSRFDTGGSSVFKPVDGSGPAVENQRPGGLSNDLPPSDEPFADPKFGGNGGTWPGFNRQ